MINRILKRFEEELEENGTVDDDYFLGRYSTYKEAISIIKEETQDGGWIPCSRELPKDYDNRFYLCIVENHEEDLPMYCQYEENYGFGFWHDYYDSDTLGFVDSEFETNEDLGYEKVIAWQQIPLYHPKVDRTNCAYRHENGNCLPVGGFCTSVPKQYCKNVKKLFDKGE